MSNYCVNCGKSGHIFKNCNEPIISCGIICFKLDCIPLNKIETFFYNKFINIEDFNYDNINYYNKINFHRNDIKFLMIQRKHSLSYIEFIRGKYDENNHDKVNSMFELMSENEINNIKSLEFDQLWDTLWKETAKSKTFTKEYNNSKNKFIVLKNNNSFDNIISKYKEPEWGFPKGRRNKYENNYECANREFIEETNLNDFVQLDRINPIEETFKGTNGVKYKHIYYIAGTEQSEISYDFDNYEIGNIGWFSIDEILKLIRPYNKTKINVINQIYFFLSIISDKIKINKTPKSLIKSI